MIENVPKDIILKLNFIDEFDRLILMKHIENNKVWGIPGNNDYWNDKRMYSDNVEFNNIIDKISKNICFLFDNKYKINTPTVHRMMIGNGMEPHFDSNGYENLKYGIIIYLNDDYEGGELFYTNYNYEYKPIKNSLIIHPTSEEYTHMVKNVKSGIRYTLLGFLS